MNVSQIIRFNLEILQRVILYILVIHAVSHYIHVYTFLECSCSYKHKKSLHKIVKKDFNFL